MKIQVLLALIGGLIFFNSTAQTPVPEWVKQGGQWSKYQGEDFITSFEFMVISGKEMPIEEAKSKVEAKSIEQISYKILTRAKAKIQSTSLWERKNDYNEYNEKIYSEVVIASELVELPELITKSYYLKKKNTVYAFSCISKSKLKNYYQQRLKSLNASLLEYSQEGKKFKALFESNGFPNDKEKALFYYDKCAPIIAQKKSFFKILLILNISDPERDLAQEIEVEKMKLLFSSLKNIEDLSLAICASLNNQFNTMESVYVRALYFDSYDASTTFSKYFRNILAADLSTRFKWKIHDSDSKLGIKYILKGTYWEKDNRSFKFHLVLKTKEKGNVITEVLMEVPREIITNCNRSFAPPGYKMDKEKELSLYANQIKNDELKLNIFIDKNGQILEDDFYFEEGDTLKIGFELNRSAKVRLIYEFEDGTKILLLDEYYIPSKNVNRIVWLPNNFRVSPPFGIESLRAFATSGEFKFLQTRAVGNFRVIEESMKEVFIKTRALEGLGEKNKPILSTETFRKVITAAKSNN